jgi:hypothetical protein
MRQPGRAGFRVRGPSCRGALARIAAWRFDQGVVTLYGEDGAALSRLTGQRTLIRGETADGRQLVLER